MFVLMRKSGYSAYKLSLKPQLPKQDFDLSVIYTVINELGNFLKNLTVSIIRFSLFALNAWMEVFRAGKITSYRYILYLHRVGQDAWMEVLRAEKITRYHYILYLHRVRQDELDLLLRNQPLLELVLIWTINGSLVRVIFSLYFLPLRLLTLKPSTVFFWSHLEVFPGVLFWTANQVVSKLESFVRFTEWTWFRVCHRAADVSWW